MLTFFFWIITNTGLNPSKHIQCATTDTASFQFTYKVSFFKSGSIQLQKTET